MAGASIIKTRLLILSDTHGRGPKPKSTDGGADTDDDFKHYDPSRVATGYREPLPEVDVLIHCGDLTKRSRLAEFEETLSMLRRARAPLKLVIAGNHDLALDDEFWCQRMRFEDADVPDKVRTMFQEAEADGVRYLTEGQYAFDLENGARLRVYASQFTPEYGGWAFQYSGAHDFNIPAGTDVAMTHGPPLGVLDVPLYPGGVGAGCPHLFKAVQRARPRIHCFGHIHEAWGGILTRWKDGQDVATQYGTVTASSSIDEARSRLIMDAKSLYPYTEDPNQSNENLSRLREVSTRRGVLVDLAQDGLQPGKQTLFVNAAIMSVRYRPTQPPWLVNIDLPASASHR